jgi:hypothetical protein
MFRRRRGLWLKLQGYGNVSGETILKEAEEEVCIPLSV